MLVALDGPPGTSLPAMTSAVSQTSQQLSGVHGVESVGAHVGRAVTGDQVVDVNSSELWVHIRADADYEQTMAAIGHVLGGVSGFVHDVVTYSGQRLRDVGALDQGTEVRSSDLEVLTGSAHPVVVRVYGEDMGVLQAKAQEIRTKMAAVTGIVNPQVLESPMQDEIQIEVDLDKARQHGIKPGDVRRAEAILLQGIQVGSIFEGQKVFDMIIQGTPSTRQSIDSVNNLLIDTPAGGSVRLAEVATVRMGKVPTSIDRDAVARRVDVTADVSGIGVRGGRRRARRDRRHHVPVGAPRRGAHQLGRPRGERGSRPRRRDRRTDRDILTLPSGVPQLAPGRPEPAEPAGRALRRGGSRPTRRTVLGGGAGAAGGPRRRRSPRAALRRRGPAS